MYAEIINKFSVFITENIRYFYCRIRI